MSDIESILDSLWGELAITPFNLYNCASQGFFQITFMSLRIPHAINNVLQPISIPKLRTASYRRQIWDGNP